MSKKHQYQKDNDEHGEHLDPFFEMLEILDTEHLLRFCKRLEKVGRKRMVEILTKEIEERGSHASGTEREPYLEEMEKRKKGGSSGLIRSI
jgi:hypothetical protein